MDNQFDQLAPIQLPDTDSLDDGLKWLKSLLDAIPVPAIITDTELNRPGPQITYANKPMYQLTGYTESELIGETPRIFQGKNTDRRVLDRVQECLTTDHRFFGETVNYHKSGSPYYVRWMILPIYWRGELVRYADFQIRSNDPLSQAILPQQGVASDTFEILFEAAEVAICLLSDGYRYLRVNRAYCEMVGLTESEILGQECFLLQNASTQVDARLAMKLAFDGDTSGLCREWQVTSKTGNLLRVYTQTRLIRNPDDKTYLVITVTNLTKLQQQEQSRLAESRFHLAVQECGLGFWDYNVQTGEVYLSPGWKQIVGYEDHELANTDETFQALLHPDDREIVRVAITEFSTGIRDRYDVTFRLKHKDGTYRWVLSRGVGISDQHGVLQRIVGKHTDITELRKVEKQLRHNQERLDTILRYATDSVLVLDAEGKRLFLGEQVFERYGYNPQELLGRPIFEQIHPEDQEMAHERFQQLLNSPGRPQRFSLRYLTGLGHTVWQDVTAINLLNNPAINGILVTAQDVTEQRRLADQLRQSQKMESLGQLAGGIAHDFNNMLSIVIGNSELGLMEAQGDLRVRLEAIQDAAYRAVDLAQQLLGFARKRQLLVRKVDIAQLLHESAKLIALAIGPRIKLIVDPLPEEMPAIRGNMAALQQALVNLGINARDAMPEGGTLTLRCSQVEVKPGQQGHPDAHSGTFLRLEVSDTGTGIPTDVLTHIFEPFYTTKPVGVGTGLGLSMVYGTIKQLGGWLEVESELGRGTCFKIYLPLAVTVNGSK